MTSQFRAELITPSLHCALEKRVNNNAEIDGTLEQFFIQKVYKSMFSGHAYETKSLQHNERQCISRCIFINLSFFAAFQRSLQICNIFSIFFLLKSFCSLFSTDEIMLTWQKLVIYIHNTHRK